MVVYELFILSDKQGERIRKVPFFVEEDELPRTGDTYHFGEIDERDTEALRLIKENRSEDIENASYMVVGVRHLCDISSSILNNIAGQHILNGKVDNDTYKVYLRKEQSITLQTPI